MNNCCTSAIRVSIEENKSLQVEVCYTHYQHGREFREQWLSLDRRRTVMSMMSESTRDTILTNARNVLTKEQKTVTFQPMRTVFGIDDVMRHVNDHVSLSRWIAEWNRLGLNPVLFHKRKGTESPYGDLGIEDFVVVIQSEIQKKLMLKFGESGLLCLSVPCAAYVLTSLCVIDEFGEGLPVAVCMSNRIDDVIVRIFFSKVKENVGELKPAWFMSGSHDNFYATFVQLTGHQPMRFVSLSSTEACFRSELVKGRLGHMTNEVGVYETVLTALLERNDKVFEDLVWMLLQRSTKKLEAFYKQFTTQWLQRRYEWANCYRPYGLDAAAEEFKNWIAERCLKSKVCIKYEATLQPGCRKIKLFKNKL